MTLTVPTPELTLHDERFAMFAEALPHLVWVADARGQVEFVNRFGVESLGCPERSLLGANWLEVVHPDDVAPTRARWLAAVVAGENFEAEYRLRCADGGYRWQQVAAAPIRDSSGQLVKWMGTATDIEDRRRAERDRAEMLTLLETLQRNAPIGIGFVDTELRVVRVNDSLAAALDGTVDEMLGRPVAEVVDANLWPSVETDLRHVLASGVPVIDRKLPTTTHGHWLINYFPVHLDGGPIGIGVVASDITAPVEAQHQQQRLAEATIDAIAHTVDARDPYTAGHQRRVADIAAAIGADLGLDDDTVHGIRLAAKIHDIGKLAVPAEILTMPRRLTPAEFELVKTRMLRSATRSSRPSSSRGRWPT